MGQSLGQANARKFWLLVFVLMIAAAVCLLPFRPSEAANPTGGTLQPVFTSTNASNKVDWNGTLAGGANVDETTCVDGVNCDTFRLTLAGTTADWAGKLAHVELHWTSPSSRQRHDDFRVCGH
ncbi:MAG: hypothetical protein AUG51_21180 [Acidobacteria bacterium 13_1_20CM_3_53_8]|nr:MAG: hypothetical protein AUG51_21180 [Acidobacteria bacterium 13_1_20CM_3_53_8]